MTGPVTRSLDPRYATGRCMHGTQTDEREPELVALVASEEAAERLVDRRSHARAVKRALRKQMAGQDLSANESIALARHQAERR